MVLGFREPFGWAVYHYGRWAHDSEYGWVWIPGARWGPAWVAFRDSDEEIGWAPLPPEASDDLESDAAYTDLGSADYLPWWVFVPRRHFLDRDVFRHADRIGRNGHFHRRTRDATHYVTADSRIVNRSIDPRRIESAVGRRIDAVRLREVADPRAIGRHGGEIAVYRPNVRMTSGAAPPESARARPGDRAFPAVPRPPETVRPASPAHTPELPTVLRGLPDQSQATAPRLATPRSAIPAHPAEPPSVLRGMPAQPPAVARRPAEPPNIAPGAGPSHWAPSPAWEPRTAPRSGGPRGGGHRW